MPHFCLNLLVFVLFILLYTLIGRIERPTEEISLGHYYEMSSPGPLEFHCLSVDFVTAEETYLFSSSSKMFYNKDAKKPKEKIMPLLQKTTIIDKLEHGSSAFSLGSEYHIN